MKKLIGIGLIGLFLLTGCGGQGTISSEEKPTTSTESQKNTHVKIKFSAVGDNLIHDYIYDHLRRADGSYRFDELYEPTRYLDQDRDISYINLETLCAGEE